MRYILFTFVGPERLADWEAMTATEKSADIEKQKAWFAEHGAADRIVGGEELGVADHAKTVRKRGITDGPFIESKELLGGFIVVEVDSEATALEMARTWPGMVHDTDRVEVWPAGSSEAVAGGAGTNSGRGRRSRGWLSRFERGKVTRRTAEAVSMPAPQSFGIPPSDLRVRRSQS